MTRDRAFAVALLAGTLSASAHAAAAEPIVVLQVQSKSWIKGSTFDADRFTKHCAEAGVTLVTAKRPDAAGIAVLRYNEVRGPGFSMFGIGEPVGFGTNISLALNLLDARSATTLASMNITAETPNGLAAEQFHAGALAAFEQSPRYQHACTVMAAALGSRSAAIALLPWAVLDTQGRAIIDTIGFVPASDLERAYVAVARRDFRAANALGAAAVEPTLLLFVNATEPRNGIGLFPTDNPANVRVLLQALPLLDTQDEERIIEALAGFLSDHGDLDSSGADASHPAIPILRAVLQVLGRKGDAFTLPQLDEWGSAGGPLAADARQAAAVVRQRVSIP